MKRTLVDFKKHFEESREGKSLLERVAKERDALLDGAKQLARLQASSVIDVPSGDQMCVAIISDLHFGSRYSAPEAFDAFVRAAKRAGATHYLCCGDILDGWRVYAGQEYELYAFGFEEQLNVFCELVPKIGAPVYFIAGNHDSSFKKLAGAEVGAIIESRLKDWVYVGEDYGMLTLANNKTEVRVLLVHPDGGCAYALSYRPQRMVEQLEGGTKPHIVCIGHYHKAEFIPSYRNVAIVQAGTFQHQTPYMKRKGVAAHVGGWILRVRIGKKANTFNAEFVAFYG